MRWENGIPGSAVLNQAKGWKMIKLADALMRRARGIVLVATCVVGVAASLGGVTAPVENGLERMRHAVHMSVASGQTVVVAIDGKSLKEVHSWPWPRSIHGNLVDRLDALGARKIVFDIDFTSPASDPRQDRLFGAAIARADGKVVLPAIIENVSREYGERVESVPVSPLIEHAKIGSIWIRLDPDAVARRVPRSVDILGAPRPSLATYLADREGQGMGSIPIDWSIERKTIPIISYADVLSGKVPSDFFRGKNVIVGMTSYLIGDRFEVPSQGRIPGLFVQVAASETLRRGDPIQMGHLPGMLIAASLICLALVWGNRWHRAISMGVIFVASIIVPMLLRSYTTVIPGAAPAIVMAGFALGLQIVAAGICEIMRGATHAPGSHLPNLMAMKLATTEKLSVVVVRVRNYVETTAVLGSESQAELLRRVYDRLRLASAGADIYQVDDHSFSWQTPLPIEQIGEGSIGLHRVFGQSIQIEDRSIDVTITVGVCSAADIELDAAVAAATLAADRAAQNGQIWEIYETESDEAQWQLSILGELDRGIDAGDVWVAYQSKFDLATKRIIGAEALVRWNHPTRGFIRPDRFIPVVEESGRIEKLTLHVLRNAIKDFSDLPDDMSVAVNISMRMLGHNLLIGPIGEMLRTYGMKASRLTLEVTESAAMTGKDGIKELTDLRNLGVHISIDDYGTGNSTLSYLKSLPADELKIDRSFVSLILTNRSDATVVDSTIKLAHALGLKVVAEGVETQEILNALEEMDCNIIQGYHIGKPVSFEDFLKDLPMTAVAEKNRAA